jgi:outer membrane protein OmpA-like peptidoglycan-associated protein/tetratricopeptide (TPR) repeat protein
MKIVLGHTVFLFLFLCLALNAFSQCDYETDKKIEKLLTQGQDRNRDFRLRVEFLQEAVEIAPECMQCRMILGEAFFGRAKTSANLSYRTAQEQFQAVLETCPDFHADAYYYMGVIQYTQEDWSGAMASFKAFLDFPMNEPEKISRNHDRMMKDVDEILDEVTFNAEFFDHPVPFNPQKVEGVSSNADEYLPMLSPDNEYLYYTRKYQRRAKGDLYGKEVEEFTMSHRDGFKSPFDQGAVLPPPFNIGDNYGGASLSVDNKELYVTVCRPDQSGYNNCDIYVSRFEKIYDERLAKEVTVWSELENLGPQINTREGWESQPSLSGDGNTLYFASARESSTENVEGGKSIDLFYSQRGADGKWGQAKALDATINGPGNEKSPFMHGDSKTLYFAANGYPGAGGYDIYFSRLQDDGSWTKPMNIGLPINTVEDEHGLIVSTDGKLAYYASLKIQGSVGFDIYRFELPKKAKPEKVVLIKGIMTDEAGEVLVDAKVSLNYVESKKVTEVKVNKDDGSYAAIVNVEKEPVVLSVEKADHVFQAELIRVADAEEVVVKRDMTVKKAIIGEPYTIDDIYYTTSSADIDNDSKAVLVVFAQYLKKNPRLKIAIHGHTDNIGNPSDNLTLSTDRAFEVMSFLQSQGIPASSLSFKGFGETKPIADNSTGEGRAKNRRTEFIITAK